MKIEKKLSNEQILSTSESSYDMRITDKNIPMMFKLIVERLYRNKLGSMIREVTSNAHDSHIEAGVDSPVIVKLTKNSDSGSYLSFIDNGVGMSPERVDDIYCSLGESTKNDSNDEIGGFGIGGKTPLAYTKSFFIITRFDGIKYTYTVRMGELVPKVEAFSQEPTDEHNGTEVKVKIPESDLGTVEYEITKQLYYFENIVFEGFENEKLNEYNIYKGKTFVYRGTDYGSSMHVCLGKVAYPIDYSALELESRDYNVPVGIKLEIGDVKVIPSREDLEYDNDTKKVIIKKLEEVKSELVELLTKQYGDVKSLKEYYQATDNFGVIEFPDENTLDVSSFVKKSDMTFNNFKYNDIKIPKQSTLLEQLFNVKRYGKAVPKRSYNDNYQAYQGHWNSLVEINNVLHVRDNEDFTRKVVKQAYLNTTHGRFYVFTPKTLNDALVDKLMLSVGAKKEKIKTHWQDDTEYETVMPKSKAFPLIKKLRKEFIKMVEEVSDNYNEFVVPEDFINERKEAKKRLSESVLKVGIPMKTPATHGKSRRVTVKELQNFRGRVFYGYRDDDYALRNAHNLAKQLTNDVVRSVQDGSWYAFPEKGMLFVQISKGNEKYMKMLGNKFLHVKHFYNVFVSRKVDYIVQDKLNGLIDDKFYEVNEIFRMNSFDVIDKEIADDVKTIQSSLDKTSRVNGYLNKHEFMMMSGVNVDELSIDQYEHKDKLNKLLDITEKSEQYLKWIKTPYRFDDVSDELKTMLELAIVK